MSDDIFSLVDRIISDAGSDDPFIVADEEGVLYIPLNGSVTGYACTYKGDPVIGVNEGLTRLWKHFTAWHELGHVFAGHIYEPSARDGLADFGCFNQEVDSRIIPRHEKTANLVSANVNVKDDDVMEVTNYNSSLMRSYRHLRAYQEKLVHEFESLRMLYDFSSSSASMKTRIHDLKHKISDVGRDLQEMESEMHYINCCHSFSEMAAALGIPERILRYKLEAMRLRGLDIDPQELESYDKMFGASLWDA